MHLGAVYDSMVVIIAVQLFIFLKEAGMKHFCKILALLAAAGGLLALTAVLCGRRKRRKRTCYVTLYHYDD